MPLTLAVHAFLERRFLIIPGLRSSRIYIAGNPRGRPKGSRNKLGEEFICELHESFLKQGSAAIERVIQEKPDVYLKLIAQVIPKEFHVRDSTLDHMSDGELADFLSEIRAAKERASRALAAELAAQARDEDEPDSVH